MAFNNQLMFDELLLQEISALAIMWKTIIEVKRFQYKVPYLLTMQLFIH